VTPAILTAARATAAPAPTAESPLRREPRREEVHVVEYERLAHAGDAGRTHFGFTRDLSPGGLCLGVDRPEPIGALVRTRVRSASGHPGHAGLSRVVWARPTRDGRFWLGLERLTAPREVRSATV